MVTGPDGSIRVDNLQAGTYTVTERAPDKYVQPESKQVTIYPGQTSSVSFSNLLKKFTVKLDKVDSETEEAQGDSSLDGALYGMFKGENLLDTYTTANGGKFTTKEYPCGSDYTIREITPSEGYLLDETIYPVGAEPGNFTLENNSIPMTATEDVILGSIAITKHTDKPAESSDSDQIEQPEEGAQFQIYLASAGSYENAKETERDLLTTDSYGFARSKDLPYGLYVVHQTKGAQGQKFVPDFSVFISEHGKTYYFILNNPTFTSLIRFEKKDAESGKIIPLAGTAVKIRNADTGEWVVQHINYPSPIDIDTFVTDSTGTLMLPEPLPFEITSCMNSRVHGDMFLTKSRFPLWWTVHRTWLQWRNTISRKRERLQSPKRAKYLSLLQNPAGCTSLSMRCRASRALFMKSQHWKMSLPRTEPST